MIPDIPKAWLITPRAPSKLALGYSSIQPHDLIVAVDGGYKRCLELGLTPSLLIGDLDSIAPELLKSVPDSCQKIVYPSHKNDTDTQLAVLHCIRMGIREIFICNDLQGRFDHALALISNLSEAQHKGTHATLVSDENLVFVIDKDAEFSYPVGTVVSVLALTPQTLFGRSRGFQYPLDDLTIHSWQSRGISNVVTQPVQMISIKSGTALMVVTFS
jgi:thiamine pyrophosphokinase